MAHDAPLPSLTSTDVVFQSSATLAVRTAVTVTPTAFVRAFGAQRQLLESRGGPCQLLFGVPCSV
eukprot:9967830-Prorocentrum_lima.AAC.1